MHLHIQGTILANFHVVFIEGLSISLLTLIQNFVSRNILKSKRFKIDTDFYRPHIDSETAWPTVRGTPNQIINLHQPPTLLLGYANTCTVL